MPTATEPESANTRARELSRWDKDTHTRCGCKDEENGTHFMWATDTSLRPAIARDTQRLGALVEFSQGVPNAEIPFARCPAAKSDCFLIFTDSTTRSIRNEKLAQFGLKKSGGQPGRIEHYSSMKYDGIR